jgi:glycerate dehydrogenase
MGVILDAGSLGPGIDLAPLRAVLPRWTIHEATRPEQVAPRIREADIVLTNKVPLGGRELDQAPRLRLISVLATGTNNIDLDAARARGVAVSNVRDYSTDSVVQHTLSLMLALAGNLASYRDDVRQGRWQESPFFCFFNRPIVSLAGKTLTIVGYGSQGRKLAGAAEALGMQVQIAARPGVPRAVTSDVPRAPLDELLPHTDVLSFHCPLTQDTTRLLNHDSVFRLKKGALVINCARGGLIDEHALVAALEQDHLAGAAIDVVSVEPPPPDHPFMTLRHPNFILTPHIAWASLESRQRLVRETAANIEAFLRGQVRNDVVS